MGFSTKDHGEEAVARVKLSEFCAKTLLIEKYNGVEVQLSTANNALKKLSTKTHYVVKVDQGIKKRGKNGLLRLNVQKEDVLEVVKELSKRGFSRFLVEPMLSHSQKEEHYLCLERSHSGIIASYSHYGGVDIEDSAQKVKKYSDLSKVPCDQKFLSNIVKVMDKEHLSFVEINPLVVSKEGLHILDAAVLADSAGEHDSTWKVEDVVSPNKPTTSELAIAELNSNSPASFSFRILNQKGAIWLLLSGGGASITIADEAKNLGRASLIGNYGEYSGGPTTEETFLYTRHFLRAMQASSAERKALIIAGGVANFTDIKKTFTGIIRALSELLDEDALSNLRVFVRRGGPNEKEGLRLIEHFLKDNKIYGSVHGSESVLTDVVGEALEYVDA